MVEVFNINDLIYRLNAGQKSEKTDNRKERTYKEVLDTIRHVISTNHSAELINVMYSDEAKEKLKNLIVRYLNQNKMSVPECESISAPLPTISSRATCSSTEREQRSTVGDAAAPSGAPSTTRTYSPRGLFSL